MIAELNKIWRRLRRPFRRHFWLPNRKPVADQPGVVLLSFPHLTLKERGQIRAVLATYREHRVTTQACPVDHLDDHFRSETIWQSWYRFWVFMSLTLWRSPHLLGSGSWAAHLCEVDDLARIHVSLMTGSGYIHCGTLAVKRQATIKQLLRLLDGIEWRHYEIWVLDRQSRTVLLPPSIAVPEVPLDVSEIVEMAKVRASVEHTDLVLKELPCQEGVLRVMTYNLHSCIGLDGRLSVRRIAEVLQRYNPHFVALQEVDVGCQRSGGLDQLEELKRLWPSQGDFLPLLSKSGGHYGIAYLTRLPQQDYRALLLPKASQLVPQESRGAQVVTVAFEGSLVEVINTHWGLTSKERMVQWKALDQSLDDPGKPQILTGDFNCSPQTAEYRAICKRWIPSQETPAKTWFGSFPLRQLDYCFVRGGLMVQASYVPRNSLTQRASDHLPLITDFKIL